MAVQTVIREKDTTLEKLEFFRIQADEIAKNCKSKRINCYSCESVSAGLIQVVELVNVFKKKNGETKVGYGDSVSLHQLGVHKEIERISNLKIIDPLKRWPDGKYEVFGSLPPGKLNLPKDAYYGLMEKLWDMMRESLKTDIFIIGANAITMKGQIVSTDGTGNRVGGMVFGPKKVIIVVGRNKITKDIDSAIKRNFEIAAPLNYLRHNVKHHNRFDNPCLKIGYCIDCRSKRRGCLSQVILDGAMEINKDRIHLILVNEDLGY